MTTALAPGLVAVRANGVWVETADGRRVMDCTSGMATVNLGHNHPRVMAAARAQLDRQLHTGGVFCTPAASALTERLAAAVPGEVGAFSFGTSGGEAVEGALRLAAHATGRRAAVAFRGGFHGRTQGALACSSSRSDIRAGWASLGANVHLSPFPSAAGDAAAAAALDALDDLHRHELPPADTACYLVEPVQGHGGCHPAGRAFLAGLRERADRHGILLILDEVQTGFGRLGAPFAADLYGVHPDLICLAKAIANGFPLSAVGGPPELLARWPRAAQGSTFGGGPVSCAAACAVLDTLAEEELPERARALGHEAAARLRDLGGARSSMARIEVRGEGLMIGVEVHDADTGVPRTDLAGALQSALQAEGVIVTRCGPDASVIRFLPPLVISDWELEMALVAFARALRRVERGAGYRSVEKTQSVPRTRSAERWQPVQTASPPPTSARGAEAESLRYST